MKAKAKRAPRTAKKDVDSAIKGDKIAKKIGKRKKAKRVMSEEEEEEQEENPDDFEEVILD